MNDKDNVELTTFNWQLRCPGVLGSENAPFSGVSGGLVTRSIISCKESSCSSSLLCELWVMSKSNAKLSPSSTSMGSSSFTCFPPIPLACLSSGGDWEDVTVCLEALMSFLEVCELTLSGMRDVHFSSDLTPFSLSCLPEEVIELFLRSSFLEWTCSVFFSAGFTRTKTTVGKQTCGLCSEEETLASTALEEQFTVEFWVLWHDVTVTGDSELDAVTNEQFFSEVGDLTVPPSIMGFTVFCVGLTT